jgi:hypothetical protein
VKGSRRSVALCLKISHRRMNRRLRVLNHRFIRCCRNFLLFPDPRATAPTRYKNRPSDHPMPSFTQELSCTDGSTDASNLSPSVHLTLHRRVGPTRHIRRRLLSSIQTLTELAAATLARTPPFFVSRNLSRVRACPSPCAGPRSRSSASISRAAAAAP